MCGRFTQQRPTSEIAAIFEAEDLADDLGGHFNVAPTDEASVVVERAADDGSHRAVVRYRWGLVPHWAEDTRRAAKAINARSETVTSSPLFRAAFARRRCIVPVDSFYEWQRDGKVRRPFRIHDPSGKPLALAGLWAGRRDPATGDVIRSCTIVTTAANTFVATLHDRMPVVLQPAAWSRWLDPETPDLGELRSLLESREDVPLAMHGVPLLVNDVRNDGPELVEPIKLTEQAPSLGLRI